LILVNFCNKILH